MRAATVLLRAGVVVRQLSKGMVRVDIVRPMGGVAQQSQMRTRELVRPADGLQVPVGPVDEVVEYSDSEDMRHGSAGQNDPSIVTLEVGEGDVVEVSVRPENTVGEVVDRQSVRPGDVVLPRQDSSEVAAVHTHLTDVCLKWKKTIYFAPGRARPLVSRCIMTEHTVNSTGVQLSSSTRLITWFVVKLFAND